MNKKSVKNINKESLELEKSKNEYLAKIDYVSQENAPEKWQMLKLTNTGNIEAKAKAALELVRKSYNLRLFDTMEIQDSEMFENYLIEGLLEEKINCYKINLNGSIGYFEDKTLGNGKGWMLLTKNAFDGRVEFLASDPFVESITHYLAGFDIMVVI